MPTSPLQGMSEELVRLLNREMVAPATTGEREGQRGRGYIHTHCSAHRESSLQQVQQRNTRDCRERI